MTTHYRVMIEHRAREDRDHPLSVARYTLEARSAVEALAGAVALPQVAALSGNLLVRATVSRVGTAGTKK